MRSVLAILLVCLAATRSASAHEVRPALLDVRETAPETFEVLWKVPARGGVERLGIYVRFPADTQIVGDVRGIAAGGAYLERWRVERRGGLAGQTIHIDGLAATGTDVLARVQHADGAVQTARLLPSRPAFVVEGAPSAWRVFVTYLGYGVEHILLGFDHLLFVLALVLIVRGRRALVATITSFTVAHSITLGLAVLGVVHVPGPPVEAAIALSILLLAYEIVRLERGEAGATARRPWVVAFTFGLLHGFGFASALVDVGLPRGDVPLALLAFNIGVEAGQLAFVAVVLGGLAALPRAVARLRAPALALTTTAIGGVAAFWLIERMARF